MLRGVVARPVARVSGAPPRERAPAGKKGERKKCVRVRACVGLCLRASARACVGVVWACQGAVRASCDFKLVMRLAIELPAIAIAIAETPRTAARCNHCVAQLEAVIGAALGLMEALGFGSARLRRAPA